MKDIFKRQRNKGFTLVEIITSITLLGMTIAVLLPIFPQIITWTNIADNELQASNLLDQSAYDIKNSTVVSSLQSINVCPNMSGPINLSNDFTYLDKYYPVITLCKEIGTELYRTHIEIKDEKNNIISDTFIYLQGEDNDHR